ncbi:MAG: DNA translocase FtsK 4TM domain-containing protein, partial [Panacagrimonas sp.]
MFNSKARASDEPEQTSWLERLPREAGMLACIGVTLFLLVALISFHPDDPGWNSSGTDVIPSNLIGTVGAWIADFLLSLFGYVAFFLPWGIFVAGIRIYRGATGVQGVPLPIRILAWFLLLPSLAGLAAMHIGVWPTFPPQGGGGMAGQVLAGRLIDIFNPLGSTLVLLTVSLTCAPLALMFSWLAVVDRMGGWALSVWRRWRHGEPEQPAVPSQAPDQAPGWLAVIKQRFSRYRHQAQQRVRPDGLGTSESQLDLLDPERSIPAVDPPQLSGSRKTPALDPLDEPAAPPEPSRRKTRSRRA